MVPPLDTHKISLQIIDAIKRHPILYINDVKGNVVRVQEFRQKVWQRISDELTLDPNWVRLRWKNLRDTYCRILKYKKKTDRRGRRKKWIFEDHLRFLKFPYEPDYQHQCIELSTDYIADINNGKMDVDELLDQLEGSEEEDYSEYLEVLEETTADPVPAPVPSNNFKSPEKLDDAIIDKKQRKIESCARRIQAKYRKIEPKLTKIEAASIADIPVSYDLSKSPAFRLDRTDTVNTIQEASLNSMMMNRPIIETASPIITENNAVTQNLVDDQTLSDKERNSTELFFNNIAETVKSLPLKAQVDVKMAVCKIVTDAEVKYSKGKKRRKIRSTPPGIIPKLVLVPCAMIDNPSEKR